MIEQLLEVNLREREDFLKIIETLTRIGIVTRDNKLVQTCHILHKRGKYYICHFKELFRLDGVEKTEISEEDIQRRNAIAKLLQEWGLCDILEKERAEPSSMNRIKIIGHSQKSQYQLKQNYTIGGIKKSSNNL